MDEVKSLTLPNAFEFATGWGSWLTFQTLPNTIVLGAR